MKVPLTAAGFVATPFYPLQTFRCVGPAVFRSQAARDYACLLDLDDDVIDWRCLIQLEYREKVHDADFLVRRESGDVVVHVLAAGTPAPTKVPSGFRHEIIAPNDLPAIRLQNTKDLIRYTGYRVTLSDRVRLLAALDDQGSLSVAECLAAFQDVRPIAGLANLVLQRFIEIDLDEAPIGPESQVRRKRD